MSVLYYFVLLLLACTVSCPNVTVNDCVVLTMGFHYVFLRLGRGRLVFFFFFILACSVMNAVDRHQHHDASSSSSSLDDRHTHPTRTTKRREEGEEQHSTTINNKHNQDTSTQHTTHSHTHTSHTTSHRLSIHPSVVPEKNHQHPTRLLLVRPRLSVQLCLSVCLSVHKTTTRTQTLVQQGRAGNRRHWHTTVRVVTVTSCFVNLRPFLATGFVRYVPYGARWRARCGFSTCIVTDHIHTHTHTDAVASLSLSLCVHTHTHTHRHRTEHLRFPHRFSRTQNPRYVFVGVSFFSLVGCGRPLWRGGGGHVALPISRS